MAEGEPEPRVPMASQDEDDDIMSHIPRGLGFPMRIQTKPPAPPRRPPRTSLPQFQRANAAIFANQEAIYEVLAHVMEAPNIFTPDCLKAAKLSLNEGNIDLQEFCGGVTHPETGKTITSYKKLI